MTFFHRLRTEPGDARYDGMQALLLLTGAMIGLLILSIWSGYLVKNMEVPPVLFSVVPWQGGNVKPEPWEPLLYHAGLFLVPLCALLVWALFRKKLLHREPEAAFKIALIPALLAVMIWLAYMFSIQGATQDLIGLKNEPTWRVLLPLHIGAIAAAILTAGILFLQKKFTLPRIPSAWLIEALCVGLFVAFLSFDPHSLIRAQVTEVAEADWFLAPVHDILHGKHLLVESQSQYGLMIFYILAALFSVTGTNSVSLAIAMMAAHAVYFSLLYILARVLCKTRAGGAIAFLFAIGWTIMHNELRFETYAEPSVTKLRNFWDVPVLLCLALEYKTGRFKWFFTASILAAIAFLYNADVGIGLALTVAFSALMSPLWTDDSCKKKAMSAGKRLLTFGLCLSVGVALFSIFLWQISGAFPDWRLYFGSVALYSGGFGAMPMPAVGAYWFVIGTYIVTVLTVLFAWLQKRALHFAPYLLSLAAYGYLAFHYYLNRSFISNLWVVLLPAALCCIILGAEYWERLRKNPYRDSLLSPALRIPVLLVGSIIMGIGLWSVAEGTLFLILNRYTTTQATPTFDTAFEEKLKESTAAIDALLAPQERLALISPREFVFLQAADRTSVFRVPLLQTVFTTDHLKNELDTLIHERHPYLFAEHNYRRCAFCDASLEYLLPFYTPLGTKGLLDIYKRKD